LGAICVDRSRGTLAHILVTDLSNGEIVLGKLGARLLPVFGLIACSWPVMALGTLLGGIDPAALVQALVVVLAVAVLGCTMALTLSVWAKKPQEVVMACYTFWGLTILGYPLCALTIRMWGWKPPPPSWPLLVNPFWVALAPYVTPPGLSGAEYGAFLGACFGVASGLVLLATLWVRRVATDEATRARRRSVSVEAIGILTRLVRCLPGPSLDRNPVLWREWHRTRPSRGMAVLLVAVVVPMCVACLWGAACEVTRGIVVVGPDLAIFSYILLILFGFLMLSALAPMALSEERQRGSLDVLMATPLSTRQIVWGKWLGTYRLVLIFALCPALFGLAMGAADNRAWLASMPASSRSFYEQNQLTRGERLWGGFVLAGGLFAHGGLVTSVGLLWATWVKRQSRAIALSASVFLAFALAWPFLLLSLGPILTTGTGPPGREILEGYGALSPYALAVMMPDYLAMGLERGRTTMHRAGRWNLAVALAAFLLLELTVRTFDRSLGRVSVDRRAVGKAARLPLTNAAAASQ
jgi:ABC-type transport system involved in multi-copper enzyme maturation permease subunit